MVLGVCEARALQSTLGELDVAVSVTVQTDSSAAKSSAERPGLLRVKHIQIKQMFLKELVAKGVIENVKISTYNNMADVLTKPLPRTMFFKALEMLPHTYRERAIDAALVTVEEARGERYADARSQVKLAIADVEWQVYPLILRRKLLLQVWWALRTPAFSRQVYEEESTFIRSVREQPRIIRRSQTW